MDQAEEGSKEPRPRVYVRRKVVVRRKAPPRKRVDVRTRVAMAGAAAGVAAFLLLRMAGITDLRALLTGLLIALVGPVAMTVRHLDRYAPEARAEPRITWLSALLGLPLGALVLLLWRYFPEMYAYAIDYVNTPREEGYTPYLSEFQEALATLGMHLVSLATLALIFAAQLVLWIAPSYWLARWVVRPVDQTIDRKHRASVAKSRTRPSEPSKSHVTRFQVGSERLSAKLRVRTFATLVCLLSSLVVMNALAWLGIIR